MVEWYTLAGQILNDPSLLNIVPEEHSLSRATRNNMLERLQFYSDDIVSAADGTSESESERFDELESYNIEDFDNLNIFNN